MKKGTIRVLGAHRGEMDGYIDAAVGKRVYRWRFEAKSDEEWKFWTGKILGAFEREAA